MGPNERVQIVHAAKRYYLDGVSRVAIAEEMGMSRFKVARMLQLAMDRGIVRIDIDALDDIDVEVSMRLRERFGLSHALAVITPNQTTDAVRASLGRAAADLLSEIVVDDDVLGFTAGRTLTATSQYLTTLASCEVVQLSGVAASTPENGVEVMRRVSRVSGRPAHAIFAPLLVDTPEAAQALRRERSINDTIRRFDTVTKAVVAIGSWDPPDSQLHDLAGQLGALNELLAQGAQVEICATVLDANGREIPGLADRAIAITTAQLCAIPEVIAVAGGPQKTKAVAAALRSGIITSLVTDVSLAQRLLQDHSLEPPSAAVRR